jgi:hypothetical protein
VGSFGSFVTILVVSGLIASVSLPWIVKHTYYFGDIEDSDRCRRQRFAIRYSLVLLWSFIALGVVGFYFAM